MLDLALQMLQGLGAAHAKGLVHRDIKPANLFLTEGGSLKILDFGLAKQQAASLPSTLSGEPTRDTSGRSLEGMVLGTVGYMSPEQVSGRPVDARSDLFAFGVVLYEMLSGHRPFERDSAIETMSATLTEDPPPCRTPAGALPLGLQAILDRCLAKDPDRRPGEARDLIPMLEACLAGRGIRMSWRARLRRYRLPILVTLGAGAASAGLVLWSFRADRSGIPPPPRPKVVALPAKVLGDPASAFLTDAVPDTLSTLLASVEGLETKVPPGSARVEQMQGDVARIAQAYQVDQVIFTTVLAQGGTLSLDVKLVEAATQRVRWAGRYEGSRSAYNALLREAAGALASHLKPGAAEVLPEASLMSGTDAELARKEGLHYRNRFIAYSQLPDFERARVAFERAFKAEPTCASALGDLALLWIYRSWQDPAHIPACVAKAERTARQALDLDPKQGTAWSVLAQAEFARRPASLERMLLYACRAADPTAHDPDGGWSLGGTVGGAIIGAAVGQHQFEQHPLEPTYGAMGVAGLNWLGRPAEALRLVDRMLAVEPGFLLGLATKGEALTGLGRLEEAEQVLARCAPSESNQAWDAEYWRIARFELALARGDLRTAHALADRAARLWLGPEARHLDCNVGAALPRGLMQLGRREDALRLLERAMATNPSGEGYLFVLGDPRFQPLRGDPRFRRLVEQGKRDAALTISRFQEARGRGGLPPYFDAVIRDLQAGLARFQEPGA